MAYYGDYRFQMHGYGGFGYDTSHVAANEKHSDLYKAALAGNLELVKSILVDTSTTTPENKDAVINGARRWTEVDYKASGFTKEFEWFDLTPLSIAASKGHWEVVKYLLEQGADPTLEGCPSENCYADALQCANSFLSTNQILQLRTPTTGLRSFKGAEQYLPSGEQTTTAKAKEILLSHEYSKYSIRILEAALKFWKPAPYKESYYSKTARKTYSNKPTDLDALVKAIDEVAVPSLEIFDTSDLLKNESRLIKATLDRMLLEKKETDTELEHKKKRRAPKGWRPALANKKSSTDSRTKHCRFFRQGSCRYGDECRFLHDDK